MKASPCENLSKNTLYKTFASASNNDLQKLCQTSKICNQRICQSEEFWQYKIQQEFGNLVFEKPERSTFRDYYQVLVESGTLHLTVGNNVITMPNIYNVRDFETGKFIIDSFGDLYLHGTISPNSTLFPLYTDEMKKLVEGSDEDGVETFDTVDPMGFMNNVKDIAIGNEIEGNALILMVDGGLWGIGNIFGDTNELTFIADNVKSIGSQQGSDDFYYVAKTGDLYALVGDDFELIDRDVKMARMAGLEILANLYYLKYDGTLWQRMNSLIPRVFTDLKIGPNSIASRKVEIYRYNVKLLYDVDTFAVSSDYIIFTNNDHNLTLLPRDVFDVSRYTVTDENGEYGYEEDLPINPGVQNLLFRNVFTDIKDDIYAITTNGKQYKFRKNTELFNLFNDNVLKAGYEWAIKY